MKPELHPEPLPPHLVYLWDWFLDLRAGFASEIAVPFVEIEAWSRLQRIVLRPWEVDGLRKLDDAYRKQIIEDVKRWTSRP